MLTIKPPISLKTQKRLSTIHQDMNEKIIGNYSLMNDSIRREELLYLTTSTPDIYFAEGSSTSVLNEITTQSRQEYRLEVINNLVNRIMLSNSENFSYQDSVYISNVLRKIGITDVNSFMKQVAVLQNETRQVNRLTRLYEDNRTLLRQLFEQEREHIPAEKAPEERTLDYREVNHLHQDIYNRLDTAKIYNEINNFTRAESYRENFINHNQMSVSEQTMVGKRIALQQIKNSVLNESAPVSFYHANSYELTETENEQGGQQSERLTPAILLNLVDQVYSLKSEEIENNTHNWYSVVSSLYESANNTIKRYDSYHKEGVYKADSFNQIIEARSEQNNTEIEALQEITRQLSTVNSIVQRNEADYRSYTVSRNYYPSENQEQISSYLSQNIDNSADINYLQEETVGEDQLTPEEQQLRIEEQLRIISERNTENYNKIVETVKKQPKIKNVTIDRRKARENMIRALENPEEIIREMLEDHSVSTTNQIEQNISNALFENMTEEVRAIYSEILRQPGNSQAKQILTSFMESRGESEGGREAEEGYPKMTEAERAEQLLAARAEAARRQQEQEWRQAPTEYVTQAAEDLLPEEPEELTSEVSSSVRNYINNEYINNENVRRLVTNIVQSNNEQSVTEVLRQASEPLELAEQLIAARAEAARRQQRQEWQQAQTEYVAQALEQTTPEELDAMTSEVTYQVKNYINNEYVNNENIRRLVNNIINTNNERSVNEVFNKISGPSITELVQNTITHEGVVRETVQRELSEAVTERIFNDNTVEKRIEYLSRTGQLKTEAAEPTELVHAQEQAEEPEKAQSITARHVDEIIRDRVTREVEKPTVSYKTGTHTSISFVHKEENHEIDEELINLIQKKTTDNVTEQTVEQRNRLESRVVENNITSQVKQVTNNEIKNIEEIVSRNIKTQLGDISDKVYNQIEKKLTNERRRRGY